MRPAVRVDLDVAAALQLRAAPRAAGELHRRGAAHAAAALPRLLDPLLGVLGPVRGRRLPDPQPDPHRRLTPPALLGGLALSVEPAALQLARAQQRRRALELLQRQQPQRVAHQHRDAVAALAAADRRPAGGGSRSRTP